MIKHLLSAVLLSTVLAACGGGSGTDTIDFPIGNNPDDDRPLPTISPLPTLSPLPTVIPIPTISPLPTVIPLPTITPVPTATPTPQPTPLLTPTPVPTVEPTPLPTIVPSPTPVPTLVPTPTATPQPTAQPSPLPTPSPAPLSITAENALELAASVTTSALTSEIPISTELASIVIALVDRTNATLDHTQLLNTLLDTYTDGAEKTRFPSEPLACGGSGNLSYSGNLQSMARFTEGDILRLTFDSCEGNTGDITNGVIIYTITTFEGALTLSGDYNLGYHMELDMSHSTADEVITIQGDISAGMTQNGRSHSTALRASELNITVDGNARALSDFTYVQAFDESNSTLSLRASGFLSSDELGGTLSFTAPQAFVTQAGSHQPNLGVFQLTDAQGATLTISVQNNGLVSLSVDNNGDGTADSERQTTWNALTTYFDS